MKSFVFLHWLSVSLLIVVLIPGVFAQDVIQNREVSRGEMDDLKQQLKQMEESMQKQQEQMQSLRDRLDSGIAEKTISGTATTQTIPVAKEELQQEIENYILSKEGREKMGLSLSRVNAEYTPEGDTYALGMKTADGNYSLNMGARAQFRYTFKDKDEDFDQSDLQDINLRRARFGLGGNMYNKDLHYYVEFDADKFNAALRDFYVYWTPYELLNTKVGYFKVPFNRQRITSAFKMEFQDRAIASESFDQDRDTGFDIYGKPFDGYMEYHAAVFQGAGEKFSGLDNTDNELMYVLGARYNPFGSYDYYDETDIIYSEKVKATIGAAVTFNAKKQDVKLVDTNSVVGTVDLGVKYKGISWNNEYYVRQDDPESTGDTIDSDGFFTQIGYFVIRKKLELATRYSMVDPNKDVSSDLQKEYTFGVNYYFLEHRSQIQADVGHYVTDTIGQDMEENRYRLQYQIVF